MVGIGPDVHSLIVKQCTTLFGIKLYERTKLCWKLRDHTRCSSFRSMLQRQVIRKLVRKLGDMNLKEILLSTCILAEGWSVRNPSVHIEIFLNCHSRSTTLLQARAYFNSVFEVYPSQEDRLHPCVCIMCIKNFDLDNINIQDNNKVVLIVSEKYSHWHLLLKIDMESDNGGISGTVTGRQIERLKIANLATASANVDDQYLPRSWNPYKSALFMDGYAPTNRYRDIVPSNVLNQKFLNINRNHCGVDDVKTIGKNATWTQSHLANVAQVILSLNMLQKDYFMVCCP